MKFRITKIIMIRHGNIELPVAPGEATVGYNGREVWLARDGERYKTDNTPDDFSIWLREERVEQI